MRVKKSNFLKGMLMGACDLVPGISAGTIAFITGIYERLINAIKGFSLPLFYNLFLFIFGRVKKEQLKKYTQRLDLGFLLTVLGGVLVAIFALSRVIAFLLENYFPFTMMFFVGLILASAKTIFEHIERHHSTNVFLAVVGLAIGVSLAFILPSTVEPTMSYLFFSGFLAVSAMLLPGISGSFVLLVLGVYQFVLNVINNLFKNLNYAVVFVLGLLGGLFVMSRVISFFLRKDKSKTLYLLVGLVVGGLSVPLRGVYENSVSFDVVTLGAYLLLFIIGAAFASYVNRLAKRN